MQINNSANLAAQAPIRLGNTSAVPAQEQRQNVAAREKLNNEENKAQNAQADTNSRQRLDFDEQAISLIERDQLAQFDSRNAEQSNQQNGQSNNPNSGYDSPSSQNQLAVAAYQSVGAIAQRDDIQQIFGVDLFA
ncbi:MAG: hypothetical protein V7736_12885 [Colwellia polaris]|jgi:hypothetical protein|uniref:hypothetical protein n=1 Tax=Colwellia polaris TaxID=326537 RepID=UPI000A16F415|nr:hypothetical protein [Colwellia polaris]|tara:strand:- start:20260 stop:20664 length:405 start_codon:yes stop_codon:yes gene_type:complete